MALKRWTATKPFPVGTLESCNGLWEFPIRAMISFDLGSNGHCDLGMRVPVSTQCRTGGRSRPIPRQSGWVLSNTTLSLSHVFHHWVSREMIQASAMT
jgi:hypothetical protein